MRRQLGVDVVDLDTVAGYVKFGWVKPLVIDSAKIDKIVHGAGYKTLTAQLKTSGTIFKKQVDGADAYFLKIRGTDQEFELLGDQPVGPVEDIHLNFTAWPNKGVPMLVVKSVK